VKFLRALIALYVSFWKAWSTPNVEWTGPDNGGAGPDHPYAFAQPTRAGGLRRGQGMLTASRVPYDQEDDHNWDWPNVPEDADVQELDERFKAIIDKMRDLPGVDAESVRIAYLGFGDTFIGNIEDEFQAWLDTPEGKFRQYLNNNGEVT
jgi:hypothetical protein